MLSTLCGTGQERLCRIVVSSPDSVDALGDPPPPPGIFVRSVFWKRSDDERKYENLCDIVLQRLRCLELSFSFQERKMASLSSLRPASHCEKTSSIELEMVELTPALRAFARRFLRSEDDIDDLVQETLLKALNSIQLYHPGTSLKSWLFTILRNTFCSNYRRRKREPVGMDVTMEQVAVAPSQEWALRERELRQALTRLSDDRRRALTLVAAGTSYEDAARICGCRIGTLKSRVSRARETLQSLLGNQLID
jgi:RNA polymerase sigma-70 factor (ECF subfamily)